MHLSVTPMAVTACLAVTFAASQQPEKASTPAEPRVELVTTGAALLVFLEHDGPYWSAGAKFAGVREYMSRHDQPGPMFMLYHRSMPGTKRRTPASLIGFMAKGTHVPNEPFQAKTIPARQVLRLTLEGKASWPGRPLKTLADWATDNGHTISGEVLEIYHLTPGAGGGIERTEFQLPLTAPPITPPNDQKNREPQASDPDSPAISHARPTEPPPAVASAPTISVGPRSEARPPEVEAIDSISALVRAARFDRVAARLLPDVQVIDHEEQVWIGQVIFRIKAAGRGVERKYPKTNGATTALAEALLKRYSTLFKDRPVDLLSMAMLPSTAGDGSRATQRHSIMRQLDALLSRIAYGAAGPEKVAEEVAQLLERARLALGN